MYRALAGLNFSEFLNGRVHVDHLEKLLVMDTCQSPASGML